MTPFSLVESKGFSASEVSWMVRTLSEPSTYRGSGWYRENIAVAGESWFKGQHGGANMTSTKTGLEHKNTRGWVPLHQTGHKVKTRGCDPQVLLFIFFNENVSYVKSCHDKSYCTALSQPKFQPWNSLLTYIHGKKFKTCTITVSYNVHTMFIVASETQTLENRLGGVWNI